MFRLILAVALVLCASRPAAAAPPVEARGRHVYVDGKPFLMNGDTIWSGIRSLSEDDFRWYLDRRQAQGFNTVVVDLVPFVGSPGPYGNAFDGDVRRPNPGYWAHVDRMLDEAERRGFLVVAGAPGFCCDSWGLHRSFDEEGARIHGEFVANRYKNRKIVWQYGGDNNPDGGQLARLRAMIGAIKRIAPNQLHVHHAAPGRSSTEVVSPDLVSLNATYTYGPDFNHGAQHHVYDRSLQDYKRTPVRPFFLTESYYEGARDARFMRRQAYWSVLSGSTGAIYGQQQLCVTEGDWKSKLGEPGAAQIQHLFKLMKEVPWTSMAPDADHKVVVRGYGTYNGGTGGGGDDYATTLASRTHSVTFAPDSGELTADLSGFSGPVTAKWMDPVSGAFRDAGTHPASGQKSFVRPGNNAGGQRDWVLYLRAAGGSPGGGSPGGGPTGAAPDVAVSKLVARRSGAGLRFGAVLTNRGGTAVPADPKFLVAFYVDRALVSWRRGLARPIAPGASVTILAASSRAGKGTGGVWKGTAGKHVLHGFADRGRVLTEKDERNNVKGSSFSHR